MTEPRHRHGGGAWSAMRRCLVGLCLMLVPVAAPAGVDETSEKSLMFAGRCMAQMPEVPAQAHLFGEPGRVFYGADDSVVLVVHKDTHCGVNAFDESAEEVEAFLSHWLERDDSPFAQTEAAVLDNGDMRISYSGHCTECAFDVHAQAYWFRVEKFTIYRLYATKPEGA
jgi:hypothetical protein